MSRLVDRYAGVLSRVSQHIRFGTAYANTLLGQRVTVEEAVAGVRFRQQRREVTLLRTMEQAVFGQPSSPYRVLLETAGYDFARVSSLLNTLGVDAALRQLCQDGVYVSIEEFKGLREARRGTKAFRFTPNDFSNPLVRSGLPALSGGTRGRPLFTTISPSNHRLGAEHLALAMKAYGLNSQSMTVILPMAHGASFWAVLALTAMGRPPLRWYSQLQRARNTRLIHPFIAAVHAWSLFHGFRLPLPRYVPFGQEEQIIRWFPRVRAQRHGVFTTPSSALRLALAADRLNISLDHTTFITVAEPLTPTKLVAIRRTGAQAFSSLGFTEFGRATYGCAAAANPDDTHVCRDAVAVIQRRRPVDLLGTEVDALLFTALSPDARKILLNMETGDYARMTSRHCACFLGTLGWSDHLEEIRSFEKLNAEGRLFFGSQLIELIEDRLPKQFGGDPTDYQLVEEEDPAGLTRLHVLVHPRVQSINENDVLAYVSGALNELNATAATLWETAGTVSVLRRPPIVTEAGKLMPLHHLGTPVPKMS